MAKISLGPNVIGEQHNVPTSQRKWVKLENILIRNGAFVGRPGFRSAARMSDTDVAPTAPNPVTSIVEILNPGNSATGREGYTPATEFLRPTSDTLLVTGWTGSGFGDLDETSPDGVAGLTTQTAGAQQIIGFSNPGTTYNTVLGVIYHVRLRATFADGQHGFAKMNFYSRQSSTNVLLDSITVAASTKAESDEWQDFFFYMENDVHNDNRMLSDADLDALTLVVELDSSGTSVIEYRPPTGNGTHQEWTSAVDGSTGTFAMVDVAPYLWGTEQGEDGNDFLTATEVGKRQSFTFPVTNTFSTITDVTLLATFIRDAYAGVEGISMHYYDSGAVEYDLTKLGGLSTPGDVVFPPGINSDGAYRNNAGLNPADSAAWENADITGGEFGVKITGRGKVLLGAVSLLVQGDVSGGVDVEIDTISAQVLGLTTSNPGTGLVDWTRLWSSSQNHFRLDDDVISPTVTDVTNSVPLNSTAPGWPVNSAVLYGQVYLVNGVDPTVYYPNGSNVFAELATNDGAGANPLTGRCVAAFGSRIHYGWTKDNATVTPERLSFSQWQNGQVHNHRSAGDMDFLDTPGGITALVPLDEDRMALFKEVGIYTLRVTGKSSFPFLRDLIDGATGCTSPKTAVRTNQPDGSSQVFFLGQNETWGYNVYAFNGSAVVPIGNSIASELRDSVNKRAVNLTAHAAIDPQTGTYWLFVPEGNDTWPRRAWVMDLTTGNWTRSAFPYPVTASGQWHLMTDNHVGAGASTERGIGGEGRLIVGDHRGHPQWGDISRGSDEIAVANTDAYTFPNKQVENNLGFSGLVREVFTATFETGEISATGGEESIAYRLHVEYKPRAYIVRCLVDCSDDGGKSWNTAQEYFLSPTDPKNAFGGLEHVVMDVVPAAGPQLRFRLRVKPEDIITGTGTTALPVQAFVADNLFEFTNIELEIEGGADDGG